MARLRENPLEALSLQRELAAYQKPDGSFDLEGARAVLKRRFREINKAYHPDARNGYGDHERIADFAGVANGAYSTLEHAPQLEQLLRGFVQPNADPESDELLATALARIEQLEQQKKDAEQSAASARQAVANLAAGGNAPDRVVVYRHPKTGQQITLATADRDIGTWIQRAEEAEKAAGEYEITRKHLDGEIRSAKAGVTKSYQALEAERQKVKGLEGRLDGQKKAYELQVAEARKRLSAAQKEAAEARAAAGREKGTYDATTKAAERMLTEMGQQLQEAKRILEDKVKSPAVDRIVEQAKALRDAGRGEEALQRLQYLVEADPTHIHAHYFAGTIEEQRKNGVAAGLHYQAILHQGKHSSAQQRYDAIVTRLQQEFQQARESKDMTRVIQRGTDVLQLNPQDTDALYFTGTAHYALGQYTAAKELLQRLPSHTSAENCLRLIAEQEKGGK